MQEQHHSKTAEAAAMARAAHRRYDRPIVFDDSYALALTSPFWRLVCRVPALHWLILKKIMRPLRPVMGQVVSRARYTEDCLEAAITRGVNQYVVVGAGLDSFALRRSDLLQRIDVFELDHPATQSEKRERIQQLGISLPDRLHFIPIDFEKQSLEKALSDSAFSREKRAFFSWLGTAPYLPAEIVLEVLRSISSYAAPRSELVFDYAVPASMLSPDALQTVRSLKKFTSRRDEPLRSAFFPSTLCERLAQFGFTVVENLSPEEQNERYFSNRDDELQSFPASYYLHAKING